MYFLNKHSILMEWLSSETSACITFAPLRLCSLVHYSSLGNWRLERLSFIGPSVGLPVVSFIPGPVIFCVYIRIFSEASGRTVMCIKKFVDFSTDVIVFHILIWKSQLKSLLVFYQPYLHLQEWLQPPTGYIPLCQVVCILCLVLVLKFSQSLSFSLVHCTFWTSISMFSQWNLIRN